MTEKDEERRRRRTDSADIVLGMGVDVKRKVTGVVLALRGR